VSDFYDIQTWVTEAGRVARVSPTDKANQAQARPFIEKHLNCSLHDWGDQFHIDWWGASAGFPCCCCEFKQRTHASTDFETVFLSWRRWLALSMVQNGLDVPAFYAVRWTDKMGIIGVSDVPTTVSRIGGNKYPTSATDIEPLVDVPVSAFTFIESPPWEPPMIIPIGQSPYAERKVA